MADEVDMKVTWKNLPDGQRQVTLTFAAADTKAVIDNVFTEVFCETLLAAAKATT